MTEHDPIHSPSHYDAGSGIECIDAMRAAFHPSEVAAFCKLNAFKYIWRAGKKGDTVEDLEKAMVYLGWTIDSVQEDEPVPEDDPTPDGWRPLSEREAEHFKGRIVVGIDPATPEAEPVLYGGFAAGGKTLAQIRERARQEFEEGIQRAAKSLHPSIVAAHSKECCTPDDASVGSPNEASTERPHPDPDHPRGSVLARAADAISGRKTHARG